MHISNPKSYTNFTIFCHWDDEQVFHVFNKIEDDINCVYANICLVQFVDRPQISEFRGDQQISLKVRTNIIRATSFVTLQRSIIETNRYWSAFGTENALFTLMWIDLISTICSASWGSRVLKEKKWDSSL